MKLIRPLQFLLLLGGYFIVPLTGQDHQERYEAIDVLNYSFEIDLNDTVDVIRGSTQLKVLFKKEADHLYLDLANRDDHGTGMAIDEVLEDGEKVSFIHQDDRVKVTTAQALKGMTREYQIKYRGIPGDGLIISENKFGDRTFFGDNWPNRAHHWLPVVDHPSDKAMVEFLVYAPGHYRVVAIGSNMHEFIEGARIFSHWKSTVPLPTKLMVIGVSPFAVQHLESTSGIPVSTWVYPQNSTEGFHDYSIATRSLEFFESYIAPYPFSKLANVQSKTVYGGMENAGCIFYSESTVTGKQEYETLFAHEIAHQWFGDAVSELNWHHVWLSEGFATYLTDIYLEHVKGRAAFVASMLDEKSQVVRFSKRRFSHIVDTSLAISVRLLNSNSYDKAAWVLHMLRGELGDELFQQCARNFYEKFKYGNALTEDFQKVVESVAGRGFDKFFDQWFFQPGHPVLSSKWEYRRNKIKLTIVQHQQHHCFEFPLEIEIEDDQGNSFKEILSINAPEQKFKIRSPLKPSKITLDPNSWLLFEYY